MTGIRGRIYVYFYFYFLLARKQSIAGSQRGSQCCLNMNTAALIFSHYTFPLYSLSYISKNTVFQILVFYGDGGLRDPSYEADCDAIYNQRGTTLNQNRVKAANYADLTTQDFYVG